MMPVAVAMALLAGAATGAFLVPWASDALLRRSYQRESGWWEDARRAFCDYRRSHPGSVPSASSPGWEGAAGIWHEEALREAAAGMLTVERLASLADAGVEAGRVQPAGSEAEQRAAHRFRPRPRGRVLMGIAGALAVPAVLAAACPGGALRCAGLLDGADGVAACTLATAAFFVCAVAMAVAVACDVRARVIPLEACAATAAGGMLLQLACRGWEGLAAGALLAVLIAAGCMAANRLCRARHPTGAIGRGDIRCMAALSLASGSGALCGFAACSACAGLYAALGCLLGRLAPQDGMPMAPFLAVWLVCGVAAGTAA